MNQTLCYVSWRTCLVHKCTCGSRFQMVGREGPDETALAWMRAVLSGDEALFAYGMPSGAHRSSFSVETDLLVHVW